MTPYTENFTFTFNDNTTCRANVTVYELPLMVFILDILNSNLCSEIEGTWFYTAPQA
jgi:hypothetical protein